MSNHITLNFISINCEIFYMVAHFLFILLNLYYSRHILRRFDFRFWVLFDNNFK